jgi:hypothetical protein
MIANENRNNLHYSSRTHPTTPKLTQNYPFTQGSRGVLAQHNYTPLHKSGRGA